MDGNLCRCTGYRPIWDAARSLCDDSADLISEPCGSPCGGCTGEGSCSRNSEETHVEPSSKDKVIVSSSKDKLAMKDEFIKGKDGWMEQPNTMFPKELVDESSLVYLELAKSLMVVDDTDYQGSGTWFKPTTFDDLLALTKEFGEPAAGGYKIVVGNTEVGIGKRDTLHYSY